MLLKRLGKTVKALLLILIFSVAQITLLLFSLSQALKEKTLRMSDDLSVSASERVYEFIGTVLLYPLTFIKEVLPTAAIGGYWGYMFLGLNSLLWGLFLYKVYAHIRPNKI